MGRATTRRLVIGQVVRHLRSNERSGGGPRRSCQKDFTQRVVMGGAQTQPRAGKVSGAVQALPSEEDRGGRAAGPARNQQRVHESRMAMPMRRLQKSTPRSQRPVPMNSRSRTASAMSSRWTTAPNTAISNAANGKLVFLGEFGHQLARWTWRESDPRLSPCQSDTLATELHVRSGRPWS